MRSWSVWRMPRLSRNDQAQVDSSKVSLDQAVANHQAGTAPLLDELRARVDYQTQQQSLISAQNAYEKDKIALARTIGLPLDQKFELTDSAQLCSFTGRGSDGCRETGRAVSPGCCIRG